MNGNNNEASKEPTKKEKAQEAGKDVAEIAAKGAANYLGGPLGGAIANKLANTRLGQNVLNAAGKPLTQNPLTKNALASAQPAISKAKPMLNAAASNMGNTPGVGNSPTRVNQTANSTGHNGLSQNSQTSTSGSSNNSGFGNNKSGLFSPFEKPTMGGNSTLGGFADDLKKAKNIIMIISAIMPILLPIIGLLIVIVTVIMQIMVVRDNIDKLAQEFTTGVEKFINFTQGEGWMTNEDSFFFILNKEYENFPYTGGDKLDIPLIAATIHYSVTVDLGKYEETEANDENRENTDESNEQDEFIEFGSALTKDQTVEFYEIAKDKLGSANTNFPGQKRLLGHSIKTRITVKQVPLADVLDEWKKLMNYFDSVNKATSEDSISSLSYISPIIALGDFVKTYRKALAYEKIMDDSTAGNYYNSKNIAYDIDEFLYNFEELYGVITGEAEVVEDDNGNVELVRKDGKEWFTIPIPVVERTMDYGYDEYKEMNRLLLQMKALLSSNGVDYSNDDVLEIAKNSSNTELKDLYNNYKKNEKNYMYSYTHYLQEVYIPFTYFYKKDYTIQQINTIVDEIYDQRDFYNYLIGEPTKNSCLGNTQAGDLKSLTNQEFIDFLGPIAQLDYNKTGVLASVTIAQAILETGYGEHTPPNSNNIFGVKCGGWPKEKCVLTGTNEEYVPGEITNINDYFRVYDNVEASIEDHSNLLIKNSRYAGITETTDYREQIDIIKKGGYATASNYAEVLKSIVEDNNLTKWDVIVNTSSNALMCGPTTSGGWTIRTTVPTSLDTAFTYETSNRGQCVWYVRGRAIEIAEELSSKGTITNAQMEQIRRILLNNIPGHAEAWYRNGSQSFNSSTNVNNLKAGSIIVWSGGSNMCSPRCGHVAIVEEVTANSVTITDGWATGGSSCPYSWDCINVQTRTISLADYFKGVKNNFGLYAGESTQSFVGYVYFLEPL